MTNYIFILISQSGQNFNEIKGSLNRTTPTKYKISSENSLTPKVEVHDDIPVVPTQSESGRYNCRRKSDSYKSNTRDYILSLILNLVY